MATSETTTTKPDSKPMSMWTIILLVIAFVYILSFIVPSGAYEYEGKTAIAGTFHIIPKEYLLPHTVILATGDAVYKTFGKLFVTLIIMGGMMGIVNSTGVLDRFLGNLIHRLQHKAVMIIPVYIFATGLLGSVGSMISTVVLFIPLGITIARQMRADKAFAVGLIILGSFTAFMTSPINMLTGVLGQEIAGIPLYSGGALRTIVTLIDLTIVSGYLIWWVKRCHKNPETYLQDFGPGSEFASTDDDVTDEERYRPLTINEILMLIVFFGSFIFFAAGGPTLKMGMTELGSIMLPVAFIEGLLAKCNIDEIMKRFVKGTQDMVGVMVFMVLATVMTVILNMSGILDTIVYGISLPLTSMSSSMAAMGMFIANAFINIFINSGSGQTAVMMPIMAPLADVVGVTRQMAVLTLQYGDGFTNLFAPTSVMLMACLSLANLSLKRWYKFLTPCYGLLFIVLSASIFIGTAIGYN